MGSQSRLAHLPAIVVLFTLLSRGVAAAWPCSGRSTSSGRHRARGASFVFRAYGSATESAERTWSRVFRNRQCRHAAAARDLPRGDLYRRPRASDAVPSIRGQSGSHPFQSRRECSRSRSAPISRRCISRGNRQASCRKTSDAGACSRGSWQARASLVLLALARLPPRGCGSLYDRSGSRHRCRRRDSRTRLSARAAQSPVRPDPSARGAQVAVLLMGWGVAQHPYLIAPDLTIAGSAAPKATLALTAMTLPIGAGVLIPSLWYLCSRCSRGGIRKHVAIGGPWTCRFEKNPDSP